MLLMFATCGKEETVNPGIEVNLPSASNAIIFSGTSSKSNVVITIDHLGKMFLGDRLLTSEWEVDVRQAIRSTVNGGLLSPSPSINVREFDEQSTAALRIFLKADSNLDFEQIDQILRFCSEEQVHSIGLVLGDRKLNDSSSLSTASYGYPVHIFSPEADFGKMQDSFQLVTLRIEPNEQLTLNQTKMPLSELSPALSRIYADRTDQRLFILADRKIQYGQFIAILALIKDTKSIDLHLVPSKYFQLLNGFVPKTVDHFNNTQ